MHKRNALTIRHISSTNRCHDSSVNRQVTDRYVHINNGTMHTTLLSEINTVAYFRQGRTVSSNSRQADLDNYDLAILSALSDNTRLTTVELSGMVHLSRTAISRRITALKRMRVLNGSADVLNYASIGFGVRAFVELTAPSQTLAALKKRLLVQPEVLSIAVIAGNGLLSLSVIATDLAHLHRFVHLLQRSGDTTTKIVFAEEKSQLTLVDRMRILKDQTDANPERI